MGENWVHHYMPETRSKSKQCTGPGESTPKKAETISRQARWWHQFFGTKKFCWLFSWKWKNCYRPILHNTSERAEASNSRKTPGNGRETGVSPRQCTRPLKCSRSAKTDRTEVQDPSASTVFTSSGFLVLPPIPETRDLTGWTEIFVEWRGDGVCEQLFWRSRRKALPGGNSEAEETLDYVCRASGELCRKESITWIRHILFSFSFRELFNLPSEVYSIYHIHS